MNFNLIGAPTSGALSFMNMCKTYKLHICNTTIPTYRPSGTLLDILAASNKNEIERYEVTQMDYGTPHNLTLVFFNIIENKTDKTRIQIQKRRISNIDFVRFNANLYNADWSDIYSTCNVNEKYDRFVDKLTAHLDLQAPLQHLRVSKHKLLRQPLSPGLRNLLHYRKYLLTTKNTVEYKHVNRICRAAIKEETSRQILNKIHQSPGKSFWKACRTIIGRKKEQVFIDHNPEILNRQYLENGAKIYETIPNTAEARPILLPRVNTGRMRLQPITMETLWCIVRSFKPSTFEDIDGVSSNIIIRTFDGIAHILLDIINASLMNSEFPKRLKHAIVIPIPKGKGTTDTRPITLMSPVAKLIEKSVQIQLTDYIHQQDILSTNQHAYRKQYSTETALAVINDFILDAFDNREIVMMSSIDFSKCFDTVPHERLIDKLEAHGIDSSWFKEYLHGHSQHVQITNPDGSKSCSTRQSAHRPISIFQGGSLSCVLYSIYANDLPLSTNIDAKIVQYADDTTVMTKGKPAQKNDVLHRLQSALQDLLNWSYSNKLKINEAKTQFIVFGSRKMLSDFTCPSLNFNGQIIKPQTVIKLIGVNLDKHLEFTEHVSEVVRKTTGSLIPLASIKACLPAQTREPIISALIMPQITYCLSIYGTCNKTQRHRLQKVLNFAVRVISDVRKREHITPMYTQIGWRYVPEIIDDCRLKFITKLISTGIPTEISRTLTYTDTERTQRTRYEHELRLPRITTESGRKRINYSAVQLYIG